MWLPWVSLVSLLWMGPGIDAHNASQSVERRAHSSGSVAGRIPEPPASIVRLGDPAPNFAFEGFGGRSMRLHHLLDQGPVLLVFGPREADLKKLQQQREALLDLGVIPVAVVDARPNATRSLVKRLGLQYTVLADSRGVIAGQFNVVDGERITPGCFILDARGRVCGLVRGSLPNVEYARLCSRALAIPMAGATLPGAR
ncbi:MAG TPA: redoxin domain-containing protein [Candidatus Eisenbacteria bacterium]|nr:redoxin domain-containing protein [Candidatus Eisenbacteria bacterium]